MTTNKLEKAPKSPPDRRKKAPVRQAALAKRTRESRNLLVLGHFCPPTQAQLQIMREALDAGDNITAGVIPGRDGLKYTLARRNIAKEFLKPFYHGKISFRHLPVITDVFQGPGSRIRTRRPS